MGLKVYSAINQMGATELRQIGEELARLVEYQKELQKEVARVDGVASAPETDPVFMGSAASGITGTDIANWNTEEDPVFGASPAGGITAEDIAAWNAASGESHDAVTLDAAADGVLSLADQLIGLDTQTANKVFAGPATGAAAIPTFRDLVDADIPSVIARDTEVSGAISTHAAIATAHHTNANDPSAGEKEALSGTSGTPGAENKYVTNADARNTDARTPAAHVLVSASHTASALTAGDFLKSLTETTFGFAAHGLGYSDVGAAASGHNHDLAYLGIAAKAADSDKLDGSDSTAFAASGHNHDSAYLGIAAKAADSDKLDGSDSSAFATSGHGHSHTTLTDIGTNAHSAIDTFISSKAAASGLASLDANTKTVQDPANATATPTQNKIPIADGAGGTLALGWLPATLTGKTATPAAHALTNSVHAETGLTTGHFLKATSATAFGFGAHGLDYGSVGAAAASHGHAIGDLPTAAVGDGDTTHVPTCDGVFDAIAGMGGHAAVTLDANADTVLSLSTQALGLVTQTANKLFGGPASGAGAVPTFRDIVNADIPSTTITAGKLSATATNILFGRSTGGAGAGEEIACTAAGRALLDDAAVADQRTTLGLGPAASASIFNTGISFDPITTNVVVNPYPMAGWTVSNSGGSAVTKSFQTVNNVPEMLLTGLTQVGSYPRLTDTAWTPTITGNIAISFEGYSDTPGAAIGLCLYAAGSTKHVFNFTLTTGWVKYTGYVSSGFNIDQPYFGYFATGATYHIRRIQIENLAAATGFYPGTRTAEDLVVGQNVKMLSGNTLALAAMTTAGFVKNAVTTGLLSGGNALIAADIPDISATYLKLTGGTMAGTLAMGVNAITTTGAVSTGNLTPRASAEGGTPLNISTASATFGTGNDISLLHYQGAYLSTGVGPHTILTIPIPTGSACTIEAILTVRGNYTSDDAQTIRIVGLFRNTATVAALIGSVGTIYDIRGNIDCSATMVAYGSDALVRITSETTTHCNWACTATRHITYMPT